MRVCRAVSPARPISPAPPALAARPSPAQLSPAHLRTLRGRFANALTTIAGQRLDRPSDVVHSHDYSFGRMNMPFLLLILTISALRVSAFGFVAPIWFPKDAGGDGVVQVAVANEAPLESTR